MNAKKLSATADVALYAFHLIGHSVPSQNAFGRNKSTSIPTSCMFEYRLTCNPQERIIKAVDLARVRCPRPAPRLCRQRISLFALHSGCCPLWLDSIHHLRGVHEEQPSTITDQVSPLCSCPAVTSPTSPCRLISPLA